MNKETEIEHPPSGKKRKVTKRNVGGQQTTIKRVRGIRGMLKDVKDMPLDILFEIFSRLNPIDVVNLTRTSKDLRAMLTSRSSISVWKAARANIVPAMPDCPDDLSEPQYAELAFGKVCHYCQRNLSTIHIAWSARRRICTKCIDTHCGYRFPDDYMRSILILKPYLPEIEVTRNSLTHYFVEFAKLWHETYDNIADPKEREVWIISKSEERKAIHAHALLCATWVEELSDYQQFLVEELTKKQLDDVAKRVAHLGWDDEVLKMLPDEYKFEEQVEVKKMCRKQFTERIFVKLDAKINEYMESVQKRRLKRERLTFLQDRLPILQKVHNDHLLTFPTAERYWYPMAGELFLYEPKIQDIVNDTSSTLESMKKQLVHTLPKIYPDAINQLIRRIDDQLLEVIAACRPEEVIDRETVFDLATTIFQCSDCNKFSKGVLRYKEAMRHSCTRKSNFPKKCQDGYFIEKFLGEKYRSHKSDRLTLSKTTLKLVPILVKICGLDPHTTTAQVMDDLDPIFECIPCGNPREGRATMTWLGAVIHFNHIKHDVNIKEGMNLERLNEDEEDVARKRIIEMQERAAASTSNPLVAGCLKKENDSFLFSLMQYMKSANYSDGILNVDVDSTPRFFYMWPPRKPEECKK